MCRVSRGDRELDLLAVYATVKGTGQFRRFIAACQVKFDRVGVWEIWNEGLDGMLTRYGFKALEVMGPDDEKITGMEWEREVAP